MSEINEELLNDETDFDYQDLEGVDEEALLQEDEGDILDIDVEEAEELNDTVEESKHHLTENEDDKPHREEKFSTERKLITGFNSRAGSKKFRKPFQRNSYNSFRGGRGGVLKNPNNRRPNFSPNIQNLNDNWNKVRKNKTVLINPRFQGIVHVNNHNARLSWDNPQKSPINPWASETGPQGQPQVNPQPMMPQMHMQPPICHPMQQSLQMHMQNGSSGMYQQMASNYFDNNFNQQAQMFQNPHPQPMQGPFQGPPNERQVFLPQRPNDNPGYNSYQTPAPIIINTSRPPPHLPNQMINNYQQNFNQTPHHSQYDFNNQRQNFTSFDIHPNVNDFSPINQNQNRVMERSVNYGSQFRNERNFNQKRRTWDDNERGKRPNFFRKKFAHETSQNNNKESPPFKNNERQSVIKQIVVADLEEDEETKKLRLEIQEQKRKREELLRWKEERRKIQLQQSGGDTSQEPLQKNKLALPNQPKAGFSQKQVQQTSPNIVVTNGFSQTVSKYQQSNQVTPERVVVVNNATPSVTEDCDINVDKLGSFLADHTVIPKDTSLMNTRLVVVKNLANGTTNKKLLSICRNIGDVQKLQRDKNERQATIMFKSVASAHAFYKKYQRFMVDLSMIEVSLKLESE